MSRISLDATPITIGRRSSHALQVLDPTVSRDHARIDRVGDQYVLEDLGSTHGTFVNQERIERRTLQANDRIRLGGAVGHTLVFRSSDEFTMIVGTTRTRDAPAGSETVFGSVRRGERNLEALLQISKALNSSLRVRDVLEKVMDAVIALTRGERCMIMLGSEADSLEIAARRGLVQQAGNERHPGSEDQYSQSVVREVFDTGEAQILTDVASDSRFSSQQSIVGLQLRTVLCVPLQLTHFSLEPASDADQPGPLDAEHGPRVLGVLYVDRQSPTDHFSAQDLSILESFASHAAIAIDNARLYEEALEKRRLEEDVRVANRIQRSLLLSDFPEVSGFDLHALNLPSRGVGGDYYEFFEQGRGIGFALGDVSGKGIPAAMLMATLQAAFLAAVRASRDLGIVCSHLNQFLYERTTPERYATFFVGLLDPDGTLQYVNAGHNPALVVSEGSERRLAGGGLPLGLFADRRYEVQSARLQPGDLVAAYSDGITEANDPSEQEFGVERLLRCICDHRTEPAEVISKSVFDAVDAYARGTPPGDDLTLLVTKYVP